MRFEAIDKQLVPFLTIAQKEIGGPALGKTVECVHFFRSKPVSADEENALPT